MEINLVEEARKTLDSVVKGMPKAIRP